MQLQQIYQELYIDSDSETIPSLSLSLPPLKSHLFIQIYRELWRDPEDPSPPFLAQGSSKEGVTGPGGAGKDLESCVEGTGGEGGGPGRALPLRTAQGPAGSTAHRVAVQSARQPSEGHLPRAAAEKGQDHWAGVLGCSPLERTSHFLPLSWITRTT